MLEHIGFVSNQVLQNIRTDGYSPDSVEKSAKMLLRLYRKFSEYRRSR